MKSYGNSQKQVKLKADLEEIAGPLLNRILVAKGPKEEIINNVLILIEATRVFLEGRQKCDSELMRIFGDIERQIDHCQQNGGADNEHTTSEEFLQQNSLIEEEKIGRIWTQVMESIKKLSQQTGAYVSIIRATIQPKHSTSFEETTIDEVDDESQVYDGIKELIEHMETNFKEYFEKLGANQSTDSTIAQQKESNFSQKTATYEVSGPSNTNNLVHAIKELRELLQMSFNKSTVSTTTEHGELIFPLKATTYEVGGQSCTNDQVEEAKEDLGEYRNECSPQERIWLDSLGIFPLYTKLKKRLLVHWWIGLGQGPSKRTNLKKYLKSILRYMHTNSKKPSLVEHPNTTVEQLAENFFDYLVQKGILEPRLREHNQVIDHCTIKPTIHEQLRAKFLLDDQLKAIASLNVDQKYLNSKNINSKNDLGDNNALKVVHLGRWHCTNLDNDDDDEEVSFESRDHIEVDGIDFLTKLGANVIFLSLRGISMIDELPDLVGKLNNLRILDLRACHNLAKLPHKSYRFKGISKYLRLKSCQKSWFSNLTHLDISECYMLNHIPKWICELSNLEVFKGYVAGSEGKKRQFCQLRDLSKLKKLKKLSIRIMKPLDRKEARGLESLDCLSILIVSWSNNEANNDEDKVWTISFPKHLEKLDIRCYPEADATELLDPAVLSELKRLYIRGGQLASIADVNGSDWKVEILRLRMLKFLKIQWHELGRTFTKLKLVEYKWCHKLEYFPGRSSWNVEDDGPIRKEPRPVEMSIKCNYRAPLKKNRQNIMLELTCPDFTTDRPTRLNLVAILDVSKGVENDNKIANLKTAMLFVINKLRSDDCLAIVTFSGGAKTIWELQYITESSRSEVENLVAGLRAVGPLSENDLFNGLDVGLNILKCNKISGKDCIILVSGGTFDKFHHEAKDIQDTSTSLCSVAVYTFDLGSHYRSRTLQYMATNSEGGMYSEVRNSENLIKAISVCLAGLLTVVVQDLTLTLEPVKDSSKIKEVITTLDEYGSDREYESVTYELGDLYRGEVRKVLVDLLLPAVDEEGDAQVLQVGYSYRSNGELLSHPPVDIRVRRKGRVSAYQPEVLAEVVRLRTVQIISDQITSSYSEEKKKAMYDAKYFLEDQKIKFHEKNELLELLSAELEELLEMWDVRRAPANFESLWSQFASSLVSSHERQRVAARGADIEKWLSFATPAVLNFIREAEEFSANQRLSLTPVDEEA